ncbi:GFA family protein [Novosphingobium sp. Gsoil 351]|uniref:GFA family protein n=1 Tax=Novosphingobium sp. Gsoil 351 TaxID=2675225 RepID=UPI001E477A8E|nr:GFA family protein [Novosphingobium sp. Gsoil 351]
MRFAIAAPPPVALLDCNCSICTRTGYLHWIVAEADFELERGAEVQVSYRFGTATAEHLFCGICGVKSFYRPRSHPGSWSVNWRCVDHVHSLAPAIEPFDGLNWEAARDSLG